MRMKSIWFLTRPFREIHVYFLLGFCWKIVFVMWLCLIGSKCASSLISSSQAMRANFHSYICMLHTFTNFCIEVACYHDDVSLRDAIKSVLELVVKILKLIISSCGGWCIALNDGKVNWLRLDSDGDDPVTDWVISPSIKHKLENRYVFRNWRALLFGDEIFIFIFNFIHYLSYFI